MRRFLILLVMFVLPLQTAWSAVAGIYGHLGGDTAAAGLHSHAHQHGHGDGAHDGHDLGVADLDTDHNADGHHDDHYHPVISYITAAPGLMVGAALPDGPILQLPAAFVSHTPPVFDRPPLARA